MPWDDLKTAADIRRVVEKIAGNVVERMRPDYRIGRIWSWDISTQIAQVLFPGNTSLMPVKFGLDRVPQNGLASQITLVGGDVDYNALSEGLTADVVRVAGHPGDWFILDFVSGTPTQVSDPTSGGDSGSVVVSTGDVRHAEYAETIVSVSGDQTIECPHIPEAGSEHVYWGGAQLPNASWTRDGTTITLLDPWGRFKVGRKLICRYYWLESEQGPGPAPIDQPVFITESRITLDSFSSLYGTTPVAWDGANQHLFMSSTNNARYYGVVCEPGLAPAIDHDFGFTTTSATSNNPYQDRLQFVRPGLVPTIMYFDDSGQYELVTLSVVGDVITVVDRQTFSQTFSSTAFLRAIFALPDDPNFYVYGTGSSGGHMIAEAWAVTMAADGTLSTPVSQGMCSPTSSPLASGFFLNLHSPLVITDRLGVDPNTRAIFDKMNPTLMGDLDSLMPTDATIDHTRDTFFADARTQPGILYAVRRDNSNVYKKVLKLQPAVDGSSVTVIGTWNVPISVMGVNICALQDGTALAILQEPSSGPLHVYTDLFGSPSEDISLLDTTTNATVQNIRPAYGSAPSFIATPAYQHWGSLQAAITQVDWVEVEV